MTKWASCSMTALLAIAKGYQSQFFLLLALMDIIVHCNVQDRLFRSQFKIYKPEDLVQDKRSKRKSEPKKRR